MNSILENILQFIWKAFQMRLQIYDKYTESKAKFLFKYKSQSKKKNGLLIMLHMVFRFLYETLM